MSPEAFEKELEMMYGWSGWGMWIIGPVMLLLIVWLLVWLVRDTAISTGVSHRGSGARAILDERFARGEIDRDEYQERLSTLERR
jgi:putative membrane protein